MNAPSLPRALWVLARPRLLPYVVLLPVWGYGWAHWDRALQTRGGLGIWLVLAAWALLHAGTMWLNAVADRDEGEVLMGQAVPVPPGTATAGWIALALCVLLAALADPLAGAAAAACAALSVAYSHPATAWKGHPVLGPLTNAAGYGLLSPMAGWAVVDVSANPRTLAVWAIGVLGILAAYFAAQAFQQGEDAARGYRTLVVTHGPRACLQVTRALFAAAFGASLLLTLAGWFPRVVLLAIPLGPWIDRWLARWLAEPGGGSETWARGFAKRLLFGGLLVLGLVAARYFEQSARDLPVAGLGTAAGLPSDRPVLPPSALRRWDAARQGNLGARSPARD